MVHAMPSRRQPWYVLTICLERRITSVFLLPLVQQLEVAWPMSDENSRNSPKLTSTHRREDTLIGVLCITLHG